jgi:hypothetical protein
LLLEFDHAVLVLVAFFGSRLELCAQRVAARAAVVRRRRDGALRRRSRRRKPRGPRRRPSTRGVRDGVAAPRPPVLRPAQEELAYGLKVKLDKEKDAHKAEETAFTALEAKTKASEQRAADEGTATQGLRVKLEGMEADRAWPRRWRWG